MSTLTIAGPYPVLFVLIVAAIVFVLGFGFGLTVGRRERAE